MFSVMVITKSGECGSFSEQLNMVEDVAYLEIFTCANIMENSTGKYLF